MHTPQDMPHEVSSLSPSPEQTLGGTQYYIEPTWNSIPHQVVDASSRIRISFFKDKYTPYGTAGTVKRHTQAQTHIHITCLLTLSLSVSFPCVISSCVSNNTDRSDTFISRTSPGVRFCLHALLEETSSPPV